MQSSAPLSLNRQKSRLHVSLSVSRIVRGWRRVDAHLRSSTLKLNNVMLEVQIMAGTLQPTGPPTELW